MLRYLLALVFLFSIFNVFAQRGKDGNVSISGSNVIVNTYTYLTIPATQGSNVVNVASAAGFDTGDLILIIQMQGATLRNIFNSGLFNETWGEVLDYHNCGRYEFQQINSVSSNQLILDCSLKNNYDTVAKANTQIVRVPRYNQFSIIPVASISCPAWNGQTGGIIAIETLESAGINGQINVNGKGFRGGIKDNGSVAVSQIVYDMASMDSLFGGEKGEGIGGYGAWYDGLGGRYGRGAAGNGGGGGNGHNSGGGGGANAGAGTWNGLGNPDIGPGGLYTSIWNLEGTNFAINTSSGGGRGGYSFSMFDQDATVSGPGNPSWGGNNRTNNGGLGGRTLNYGLNTERLFMGGGGGAGDGNDVCSNNGASGGGIVFIISHDNIAGSGFIRANGANAALTPYPGNDAPGGGGGGGSVILNASGSVSGITVYANGGEGGSQNIATVEAEGPGGGGGGGYIAHSGGAFNQFALGGANGTTNSLGMTEFPPNGATKGGNGLTNQSVKNFSITTTGASVCPGNSAQIFATLTGNYPVGTNLKWYYTSAGGTAFHTGSSWTTPLLYNTTTYYVGSCPGSFRVPVTVNVFQPPIINAGIDTSVCMGSGVQLNASGGTSYSWMPASSLDFSNISNPIASPIVHTTYTVTASDINGCTNSDQIVVTVNDLPQVVCAATQTSVCLGQSTTVYATGGISYQWNTGHTVSSFSTSPILPSIYEVTVTDDDGCINSSSVSINVWPVPNANAGTDTSVCFGASVQLNASGGITYSWQPSTTLNSNSVQNPVATPLSTTTYTVTVFNNYNCSAQDNIVVFVNPLPIVSAGTNQSICFGDTAVLTAIGGILYQWSNGATTQSIDVSPQIGSTYIVTATDANGCTNTDNVFVDVLPLPIAFAGNDTSICPGVSALLSASGGVNYSWSPATDLSNIQIANPVATPTTDITYTVIVTDSNGCSQTDDVAVSLYPLPDVFIEVDANASCPPFEVHFNDTVSSIISWLWNFGDPASGTDNLSSQANPSHVYNSSGTYGVALTVTSVNGCTNTEFFSNLITVYPEPVASFEAESMSQSIFSPVFSFINNSVGSVSWLWHFGNITQATSTEFEPTFTYNEEGTYTVSLVVLSQEACVDSTSAEVVVKPEFTFFIPNVFTPDDDGLNDNFRGIGRNFTDYHMLIYDRWGALVYETDDYDKPWNGKVKNGSENMMSGVYVYIITVKDQKNRPHIYRGHVTLLRALY